MLSLWAGIRQVITGPVEATALAYGRRAETPSWVMVFRIIGVALSVPLATVAAVVIGNDDLIRRTWLEEFAGFDRQLIVSHLPQGTPSNSDRIRKGKLPPETEIWRSIDPRFLELSKREQVEKIESLLQKERNGYPTPALFQVREVTSFPQGYQLEVRQVSRDRWLGLAGGAGLLILLIVQVVISLLVSFIKRCAGEDESASNAAAENWMGAPLRYSAPRAAGNRF